MRPIDADALMERMYHDAFETDTDMQKWDSGCWIRYKMFENAIDEAPTIDAVSVVHGEWIPCSERLPEENVAVLTQAKFKDDIKMAVSARQDYNYWTGWGTREVNIVAWMPLPEPYGEREGE